jgi:hypothetical protein
MVGEVVGKDMMKRMSKVIDSLASSVLGFSTCVTAMAIQGMWLVDRQMCHSIGLRRLGGQYIEDEE